MLLKCLININKKDMKEEILLINNPIKIKERIDQQVRNNHSRLEIKIKTEHYKQKLKM